MLDSRIAIKKFLNCSCWTRRCWESVLLLCYCFQETNPCNFLPSYSSKVIFCLDATCGLLFWWVIPEIFYLEVSALAMRPQTTQSIISLSVTISLQSFIKNKNKKTPSEVFKEAIHRCNSCESFRDAVEDSDRPSHIHTFVSTCSGLPSYCGTAAAAGSSQTDRSKIWAEAPPGFGAGGWRKSLLGSDGLPVMGGKTDHHITQRAGPSPVIYITI